MSVNVHICVGAAVLVICSAFQENEVADAYLGKFGEGDTLVINARFADCGEWGGHAENIKVFRSVDGELTANYERDTLKCPNPTFKARHIVERKSTVVTKEKKAALAKFIAQLIGRTYHPEEVNHASDIYGVQRRAKSLKVEYWNYDQNWSSAFIGLKKELFDSASMQVK